MAHLPEPNDAQYYFGTISGAMGGCMYLPYPFDKYDDDYKIDEIAFVWVDGFPDENKSMRNHIKQALYRQ